MRAHLLTPLASLIVLGTMACSDPTRPVPTDWRGGSRGVPAVEHISITGVVMFTDPSGDAGPELALSTLDGVIVPLSGTLGDLDRHEGETVTATGSYGDDGLFIMVSFEIGKN